MKYEPKSEKAGVSILTMAQHLKYTSLPALRLGDLAPEILCWDIEDYRSTITVILMPIQKNF